MGSTRSGFWYPDQTANVAPLHTTLAAMQQSIDDEIANSVVPRFTTVAERDDWAAQTDIRECWVGDQRQIYSPSLAKWMPLPLVTTDWTPLTYAAGVTAYGEQLAYRILGGVGYLRGGAQVSAGTWGTSGGPYALTTQGVPVRPAWSTGQPAPAVANQLRRPVISIATAGGQMSSSVLGIRATQIVFNTVGAATAPNAVICDGVQWHAE